MTVKFPEESRGQGEDTGQIPECASSPVHTYLGSNKPCSFPLHSLGNVMWLLEGDWAAEDKTCIPGGSLRPR